ncbi:MAG: VOC family protein [Pseudomonadota bacterium]
MFDHIGIVVSELKKARDFYTACLMPLSIQLLEDHADADGEGWLVYGTGTVEPFFVVAAGRPSFWQASNQAGNAPDHIAFMAMSSQAVDEFHQAGLDNHGLDNGLPGPRPAPAGSYYAAYLIDPDGNNVEAGYRK